MALQKSKTAANGVTGNYWKIVSLSCDKRAMTLTCKISLFLSKEVADTVGSVDLGVSKMVTFPVTKEQLLGNLTELAYSLLKARANTMVSVDLSGKPLASPAPTDPDLAGAIDV